MNSKILDVIHNIIDETIRINMTTDRNVSISISLDDIAIAINERGNEEGAIIDYNSINAYDELKQCLKRLKDIGK